MKVISNHKDYVLVLKKGEELIATLKQFAQQSSLKSAWVSGLGGASSVVIAWYDIETKRYIDRTINDALEIASLTGNLATVDDQPFWHIHGVFSGRDYASVSGHVKSLTVGLTCELYVTPLENTMTRALDPETGLKLLDTTS